MNLPKRDGLHDRYYLIHKPETAPEVLAEADVCIQDVLDGTARENRSGYPTVVRNHNGTPFLPSQLLERYLSRQPLKGFPYDDAVAFCDALRRLAGWKEIGHTLDKYIEKHVQKRYFVEGEKESYFSCYPPCTVSPELRPEYVDENLLRFVCYAAVCHTVYGISCESVTTKHLLGLVSQLRPDMVKELKDNGSGKLPPDIQKRKTKHLTASANDAFAVVRITASDCSEGCCAEALEYLCLVLEQPDFPRSYSVEFRGPEKIYLPIPGLPKKGVNQLFACAMRYPRLHGLIAQYARLAMREDEWYNNLAGELCAMPGTFAVFALGMEGTTPQWLRLVCDYLDLCDDEHSSLQEKFIHSSTPFSKNSASPRRPCPSCSTAYCPCRRFAPRRSSARSSPTTRALTLCSRRRAALRTTCRKNRSTTERRRTTSGAARSGRYGEEPPRTAAAKSSKPRPRN